MISSNILIERKKREAMRLLSSSVSNRKVRGQNIETVLNVLHKQMSEVQPDSVEWQTLSKEYNSLLRKYNPALYSTMGNNEGTIFTANTMISRVQSSASKILETAKITTDMSAGISSFNSSAARAYGAYIRDTGATKSPLVRSQFVQKVFSTKSVKELQDHFNVVNTSKGAAASDLALAAARLDMRRNLDMIARASGIDPSTMASLNRQLSFGVTRMERLEQMREAGKTISDIEKFGYNKKEYQAAKIRIEKTYGYKKVDSGFLLKDDIYDFIRTKGLFEEEYLTKGGAKVSRAEYLTNPRNYRVSTEKADRFYSKMKALEKGSISGLDLDEKEVDKLISSYRELFGFHSDGFVPGLSETTDGHGILNKDNSAVLEFKRLLEKVSGESVNKDVIEDLLDKATENRRAALGGGNLEYVRKIIEERAVGGGSAYFPKGELTDLHRMKLTAEMMRTGPKQDFGLQSIIGVIDSAIIASGGDQRQLAALKRAARGSSLWNLRQAQQAPLQAMMLSNWQNLYGGAIANTGGSALMPDIFKGRNIIIEDYLEETERILTPKYDSKTGKFISGDFWEEKEVIKGIKFKGFTDIATSELAASRDAISVGSQAQKVASKELIEELSGKQSSYSIQNVFEWMMTKSRMVEQGQISMEDVAKALDGNKTAIDIFSTIQKQYAVASNISGDINYQNLLKSFQWTMSRAFVDVNMSTAEGVMSATAEFSQEAIIKKQQELANLFGRIFPHISTVQEASRTSLANSLAKRAASGAFIRPSLPIRTVDEAAQFTLFGTKFMQEEGEDFTDVLTRAKGTLSRKQLKTITPGEEVRLFEEFSRGRISGLMLDEIGLDDRALGLGRTASKIKQRALRDIFGLSGGDIEYTVMQGADGKFYNTYVDESGRTVKQFAKIGGEFELTDNASKTVDSLVNAIINQNAEALAGNKNAGKIVASGLLEMIQQDDRLATLLGAEVQDVIVNNLNKMLTGMPDVRFEAEGIDEKVAERLSRDISEVAQSNEISKGYYKVQSSIDRMMKQLGIEIQDGEVVVGRGGQTLYRDQGGIRNIASLLELESKDRTLVDKTLMAFRNELLEAGDNRKLREQIQTRAMRDIDIAGVRNFTLDIAEQGKYITLQGMEDGSNKNITYLFQVEQDRLRQVTAEDVVGDFFRLKGEFRGKDFIGHATAPSSYVESQLRKMSQQMFGDEYDDKLRTIASQYFGMETHQLSGDDIVKAFAATEDLPLHSMQNGIMREDLIEEVTGIRPNGRTIMRPSELLGLAIQNEGEFADSEFSKLGELVRAVSANRGEHIDAQEEATRAVQAFRQRISETNVGAVAQTIIDNDFNTVNLGNVDDLFRASQNAPERIIKAASDFMSDIRGGKHRGPVLLAAGTIAALTIAGTYSKAKEVMPTDPTHGTQTRISMNDEGYGNSSTPDRYSSYVGGINSSELNALSGLASATINDNISSLEKDFMR